MKLANNIETSTQAVNMPTGETVATEQNIVIQQEDEDLTFGFFAVGMVINVVMLTAYFIWAFKQWNKN